MIKRGATKKNTLRQHVPKWRALLDRLLNESVLLLFCIEYFQEECFPLMERGLVTETVAG